MAYSSEELLLIYEMSSDEEKIKVLEGNIKYVALLEFLVKGPYSETLLISGLTNLIKMKVLVD